MSASSSKDDRRAASPSQGQISVDNSKSAEHEHIEKYIQRQFISSPIYKFLLSKVCITSATKGHFVGRMMLTNDHMNGNGGLHGSVSATIVDWAGGLAIATHDLRDKTGASIDIHVTYQSMVTAGSEIEIEGIAERVGGSVAFTRVNIYAVIAGSRGRIVATGTHTNFVKSTEPRS